MPQALTDTEIATIISAAIATSGATTMQEMSKVMAIAKPQLAGRADMGAVSKQIKAKLGG